MTIRLFPCNRALLPMLHDTWCDYTQGVDISKQNHLQFRSRRAPLPRWYTLIICALLAPAQLMCMANLCAIVVRCASCLIILHEDA